MNRYSLGVLVILGTVSAGCAVYTPKVEHLKFSDGSFSSWKGEGIIYALPKTNFDLEFEISRSDFGVPKCTAPSDSELEILGIKREELSTSARSIYALHASKLTSRPTPDFNKIFVARLPEHSYFANSALIVKMGENGVVESVDTSATSRSVEMATKVIELGLKVASGLIPLGAAKIGSVDCQAKIQEFADLDKMLNRYRANPIPFPKETIDKYQSEIRSAQAAVLAHFIGESKITKGKVICSVSPANIGDIPLFNVSSQHGFENTSPANCKFSSNDFVNTLAGVTKKKTISLSVSSELVDSQEGKSAIELAYSSQAGSLAPSAGFFYNAPAHAFVKIQGHEKANTEDKLYTLPQFGSLRMLPQIKGNSPALIVELHPSTGAIKSVKVSNTAADLSSIVGAVSSGTSTYLTALATQKEKDAAAEALDVSRLDSLTLLNREKDLLETELAIRIAREALAQYTDSDE